MKSLGIAINKNKLSYSVLRKNDSDNIEILEIDKKNFQSDENICDLMQTFYHLFSEIISKHTPSFVVSKLSLNIKKDQVNYLHCPIGILAYLCKNNNLKFSMRSIQWITANKGKKLDNCKNRFLEYEFKDDAQLHATVIALDGFGNI